MNEQRTFVLFLLRSEKDEDTDNPFFRRSAYFIQRSLRGYVPEESRQMDFKN
jgi:hypothetical protein